LLDHEERARRLVDQPLRGALSEKATDRRVPTRTEHQEVDRATVASQFARRLAVLGVAVDAAQLGIRSSACATPSSTVSSMRSGLDTA
jgi:hypothetical protein